MGQTVNLLVFTFGGSNPSLPTFRVPIGVAKPTATVREGRLASLRFGEVTGGCLVGEGSSVEGLPLCRR